MDIKASDERQSAQIMIMLVGVQISIIGAAFSDYLLLVGAMLTFSVVVREIIV